MENVFSLQLIRGRVSGEMRRGGWEGKHQCHLLVLMRPECDLNVENMKMIPIRGQTSGLLPKKERGGDPRFQILGKIL